MNIGRPCFSHLGCSGDTTGTSPFLGVTYQIKAMLEHAEISIQEAEQLAACSTLAKEDRNTTAIKRGIALVKRQWAADELPDDIRRLAANITNLVDDPRIDIERLEIILNEGKAGRAGVHPANLSPYESGNFRRCGGVSFHIGRKTRPSLSR